MNADLEKTARRFRIVATLRRQWSNPDFKPVEFDGFGKQAETIGCELSVKGVKA